MTPDYLAALLEFVNPYFQGALYAIRLVLFALVPMVLCELIFPARKVHLKTVVFNLAYAPVYLTLAAIAAHPLDKYLSPYLPHNMLQFRLQDRPWWATGLLAFVYFSIFDFFYYWFHRAQHRFPLLWRYHRFHHADVNLSASAAIRHHWMEDAMRYFVMGVPLLLLFGQPERTLVWLGIFIGVHGMFIHWNSRLRFGPLTSVLIGPQYHRIHHSLQLEHYDKNFGIFLPLWDKLFGTQALPKGKEFPETGVSDGYSANGLAQLLPYPVFTGKQAVPAAATATSHDNSVARNDQSNQSAA